MKRLLLFLFLSLSIVTAQVITIAEARATAVGDTVTIKGIITTPDFQGSNTDHGVQDHTAGIAMFHYDQWATILEVGDSVQITGEIEIYNGKTEIIPGAPEDVIIINSGNSLPDFQLVTVEDLVTNGEDYESELVRLDSVSIVSGTWPSPGANAYDLIITDPSGITMTMFIDKDMDLDENEKPQGFFKLQGIAGQWDDSEPYDEGYQIVPRYYTDIEVIGDPPPQISDLHQDPASPTPNDDVTVTATVTDNNAVASVVLTYSVNGGVEVTVTMTGDPDDLYTAIIPAQNADDVITYYISATDDAEGVSTSAEQTYSVYGGTVWSIASIQGGTLEGTFVTVQGIVTAEPYAFYPEDDLHYYYIQDDEAILSGIKVYDPGRALAEGDEIRISGQVAEYFDMTEIETISAFELLSKGNTVQPMVVGLDVQWEDYEGCLIEIQNVTVADTDLGYGEWSATDGTNTLVIDDAADYYYFPEQGETLASITGVLDYSYDEYKLQPRLAKDIVTADGLTRIQAIQQVRYSDILPHYSPIDGSVYFADTSYMYSYLLEDTLFVTVQGIVTMPTGLSYAGAGIKFIYQDVNGGPWSSILSYDPDSAAFPVLFEGDLVEATGYISEFTTVEGASRSSMTELFITEEIDILDIALPLPEEPVVKTGDLRWPPTAEQWGNVVVKVKDATILENNPTDYDILAVDDGTGRILVEDDSDSLWNYIQPPVNSVYEEIRGWVYNHYGSYSDSSTYKLVPLYKEDLILKSVGVDDVSIPQDFALTNYPNPFNPTTTIAFRIPENESVKLVIYNQLGQVVNVLVDQNLSAGDYQVEWNGMDRYGKPVASGLYFYRLAAGQERMVRKMTYLK